MGLGFRTYLAPALVLPLVLAAGCSAIGMPGTGPATESVPSPTSEPPTQSTDFTRVGPVTENIDPVLAGLIDADNRSAFAESHGLTYQDGRVLAVVELASNSSIPAAYDIEIEHRVTVSDGVVVQGYLAIDDIRPLVQEPFVRSIRPPESAGTVG